MMNLYREEEYDKPSFSERFRSFKEDIKLEFETSSFSRNKSIKQVSKAILNLDPSDANAIQQIKDIISRKDLCDPRFGKTIDEDVMKLFVAKVMKNRELSNNKTAEASNKNNSAEMGI